MALFAIGVGVAVVSALRGIWSPCGLSMLTSINPFSERSRNHRYWVTASWFLCGSVLGGAALGGMMAIGAFVLSTSGLGAGLAVGLAALAVLAACLVDAGVFGLKMPVLRRQVNERWLDQYRGWFYGFGFGWQIGFGVATYVMTSGVFATIAIGVLTRSPLEALLIGTLFGLVRGCGVFVGARASSPATLRGLIATLDRNDEAVRRLVVIFLFAAGSVLGITANPWLGGAIVVAGVIGIVGTWRQRAIVAR